MNEYPGDLQVIAGVCFALENTTQSWQVSDQLLNKLQREIKRNANEINDEANS